MRNRRRKRDVCDFKRGVTFLKRGEVGLKLLNLVCSRSHVLSQLVATASDLVRSRLERNDTASQLCVLFI